MFLLRYMKDLSILNFLSIYIITRYLNKTRVAAVTQSVKASFSEPTEVVNQKVVSWIPAGC